MLTIFADALLIAARQAPLPPRHPSQGRTLVYDDHAPTPTTRARRRWFGFAGIRL